MSSHLNKSNSTSFLAFESASSSLNMGIALDDSEAYRFTMATLSIKDDVFPDSLNTVRSFFRISAGGKPKPGPDTKQTGKE